MNPVLAYRTLCAFADRHSRGFAVFVYCLFAVPALALVLFADFKSFAGGRLSIAIVALAIASVLNGFVWVYYPNNGLRLMREARRLAMPSVLHAVLFALGWLSVVTILLPAALFAWYSDGPFLAFLGVLASVSFAAMLFALMSMRVITVIIVTPYAAAGAVSHFGVHLPAWNLHFEQPVVAALSLAVAAVLATLCVLRWVQMLRHDDIDPARSLLEQHIYQRDSRMPLQGSAVLVLSRERVGARVRPGARLDVAGLADPAYAMSVWLGPPEAWSFWRRFARTGAVIGWKLLVASVAGAIIGRAIVVPAWAVILPFLGTEFGISLLKTGGPRWRQFFRPGTEVFSELALLPGWGDGHRARRIFLKAALKSSLEFWMLATGGIELVACLFRMGGSIYLSIPGVALVFGSTCAASSLFALAEQEPVRDRFRTGVFAASVIVWPEAAFWIGIQQGGPAAIPILLGVCLAWSAAMVWVLISAYRRFAARSHPFLMP